MQMWKEGTVLGAHVSTRWEVTQSQTKGEKKIISNAFVFSIIYRPFWLYLFPHKDPQLLTHFSYTPHNLP